MSESDWKILLSRTGLHTLNGVARGAEGYVLAQAWKATDRSLVYVSANGRDMQQAEALLNFFLPGVETVTFPAWDCLPYDRSSPNPSVLAARAEALALLAGEKQPRRILLTTVNAALQRVPPRAQMQSASFALEVGGTLSSDRLTHFLTENGYRRSSSAMDAGEFAVRGSLIDIVTSAGADGLRLDLFGDTLEQIRSFSPASQISHGTLERALLRPAGEVALTPASCTRFREQYRARFGAAVGDPVYESVSEGRAAPGMEHLLPLFFDGMDTIFDYMPNAALLLDSQAQSAAGDRLELIADYYEARRNAPQVKGFSAPPYSALPPDALYLTQQDWEAALARTPSLNLSTFADENGVQLGMRAGRNFSTGQQGGDDLFNALATYAAQARTSGRSTLIACQTQGSRERVAHMLQEHKLHPLRVDDGNAVREISGKTIGLAELPLEHGFETDKLAVISEQDLLGERIIRRTRRRKNEDVLALASNFMPGELVVHKEHGIGRFDGLETLEVQGARHDCLKLVYDGDDKLFLPVENIDLVSRYGSEEEGAKLDKLGSASWQARKARLKERITIMAHELLQVAAARATSEADSFAPPPGLYDEFCARFPFAETDDQARAIDDVLADLTSGRPADRLVCGDVGFGKTEVALRAAFVAASSRSEGGPVQVAVICPTTLLCRQHFRTFAERFAGLPFKVRQLSRLTTAKENKLTLAGLADGSVNIVIGTHALLGKAVKFHNLGLLVIDEEQHFGVGQKEKLKALRADIHVLTLTATPIPRTLQLALSGVRELSIIATPPVDRLAIRTFVMPTDPVVLREAIMREFHRGGKLFYVTPRIEYIGEIKNLLAEIAPEIRVAAAHGQMPPAELEKIMNAFYDGEYDLLLSTSIVESGLDIPSANTIIVDRAHMFGLSQLYQMRGRVGRGKARAYAYLTLPHKRTISHTATRRLEVMQTLDSLGAGFSLASHDMDIRGFGNLLGDEQSGQVREVGIELYQQMLEEAIASARAGDKAKAAGGWSPQINLGMAVMIPEEYVQDLELRLTLYRRAAALATEEDIHSFAAELVDRFGPVPPEAEHLLAVMRIKQLCLEAGVERVDAGPKGAVLTFRENKFTAPEKLLAFIAQSKGSLKLRPDQKLVLLREWDDEASRLKDMRESIAAIASLAA